MSTATLDFRQRRRAWRPALARTRGLLVAVAVLVLLFLVVGAITPGAFSYFELSFMSAGGATLALAAMGQTLVVLTGGVDLSTGGGVSLVHVGVGRGVGADPASPGGVGVGARGVGGPGGGLIGVF